MNNNNIHAKWELQRSTQFSNRTSVKEAGVQIFVIEHYRDDEDSRFYTEKSIASLPDIMRENEELKARCETYKKDYDSMVAEVLRLSGENSKMREALCNLIKVSGECTKDIVAFENADILDNCIDKAKAVISK